MTAVFVGRPLYRICSRGAIAVACGMALSPDAALAAPIVSWRQQVQMVALGDDQGLSVPSLNGAWGAFTSQGNLSSPPGLYRWQGTATPQMVVGQPLSFPNFSVNSNVTSIDQVGNVSFVARVGGAFGTPGLFEVAPGLQPAGTWNEVILLGGLLQGGPQTVTALGAPSRSFGVTAFSGELSGVGPALFVVDLASTDGLRAEVMAGQATPTALPLWARGGYSGKLDSFGIFAPVDWDYANNTGTEMAFLAYSTFSNGVDSRLSSAIMTYDALNTLEVVAEKFMPLPNGKAGEKFGLLNYSPSLSKGWVAFTATGDLGTQGVYVGQAGVAPTRVVDTTMVGPHGFGRFVSFGDWVSIDDGAVLFEAVNEQGYKGLFRSLGGYVTTVFDEAAAHRMVPGLEDWEIDFGVDALLGDQVAFVLRGLTSPPEGSGGLFSRLVLATGVVPEPGTASLVALALFSLMGLSRSKLPRHQV